MEQNSTVILREQRTSKKVQITSLLKPEIINDVVNKWQSLLDTSAQLSNVPSALIMRLNQESIQVFLKSNTEGNPYTEGEEAKLVHGLYCETVIGEQKKLLVSNATKSPVWGVNNPDVDLNMISYLGFPLNWPDGEVFGTVCFLDSEENNFKPEYQNLLAQIKQHCETDLQLLLANQLLKKKNDDLTVLNDTKSKFISLISHDLRNSMGTPSLLLKLVTDNFDNYDNDKLKQFIQLASNTVDSSVKLMEDLLIWAKHDFVRMEPEKVTINLFDCFHRLLADYEYDLNQKKIKVDTDQVAKDANIWADENMLKVILRNILSNAIKYSNENGRITIKVEGLGKSSLIEIADKGIGMSEAKIANLFSYDKSHEKKGTKGESSAGIGLMLVKEFIDKHDAKISIESTKGVGSKFKIVWP